MGPLTTSGYSMVNRYITMNAFAQSIPQVGVAIGDTLIMFAVGYSYENYGPFTIWSYFLMIGVVSFSVVTIMQVLGHYHGDRFAKE